jgi:hypothetical protein
MRLEELPQSHAERAHGIIRPLRIQLDRTLKQRLFTTGIARPARRLRALAQTSPQNRWKLG